MIPNRFKTHTNAFQAYWSSEQGAQLLKSLGYVPSITEAKKSIPLLYQTDHIADAVITEVFVGNSFQKAMKQCIYALQNTSTPTSPALQSLITEMHTLPKWYDAQLLNQGAQVCNYSGKSGLIVLRNYSLMIGYQSAAINKPLIATGALHKGAVKRIAETTEFWFEVTAQKAFTGAQEGKVHALKTRLIHAYSRYMIKAKTPWSITDQGEPLNNWDMLATYLGFSLVFILGVRKLGLTITDHEAKAVFHLWKYIGYLIGIPPELLPDTEHQAIEKLYLWSKTQPEADADSIALAMALHQEPLIAPFPKRRWEKIFIQKVNLGFNYNLIGAQSCKILQLPESSFYYWVKTAIAVNIVDDFAAQHLKAYKNYLIQKGRREQSVITSRVLGK